VAGRGCAAFGARMTERVGRAWQVLAGDLTGFVHRLSLAGAGRGTVYVPLCAGATPSLRVDQGGLAAVDVLVQASLPRARVAADAAVGKDGPALEDIGVVVVGVAASPRGGWGSAPPGVSPAAETPGLERQGRTPPGGP
jgi:hypothetical protein